MSDACGAMHTRSNRFNKRIKTRSRAGQALVEYVLLITVGSSLALAFYTSFNRVLGIGAEGFSSVLEGELQTGGFSEAETLWQNP